jgi:hypothetical protein
MDTSFVRPASVARSSDTRRWLALGAVAGPALVTLAWLVLGVLSPGYTIFGTLIAPYSPISQPISGLGLGVTGPFMNAAFVLSGLLLLAGVLGVFQTLRLGGRPAAHWTCAMLLALSGVGLVLAGSFTLESPLLHLLGALLGLVSPVLSLSATGLLLRSSPRWRRFGNWLLVSSPLTLLLVVAYFASFDQATVAANQGVAGLVQRVLVVEIHGWFVALGWLAFRRAR